MSGEVEAVQEGSSQDHDNLSKRARKRQAKAERWKRVKALKSHRLKENKAKARKEKLAAIQALQAGWTLEEKERDKAERKERARAHREEQAKLKQLRHDRLAKAKEEDTWRVVIDFDFEEQMTENEIKSITQQTNFAFGANGQAKTPVHLVLTSVKNGIKEAFDRQLQVYESWAGVTVSSESYTEVYKDKKDQLVYLTADSDVQIDRLSPQDIYVIGGIVDRNRHKGICYERAQAQGIRTARLPIDKHLLGSGRSMVMCTNHVVDMLLGFLDTEDWGTAVQRVLPERKRGSINHC
jgi:tRNA (guanine9-N1)-methyltransferase